MIYEFRCSRGHNFEVSLPVAEYQTAQTCGCGASARRVISVPRLVFGQRDCRYTSPVDDRPITSWAQRRDDLARNGCQEYDPEMKKDVDRRIAREAAELERSIDSTVEAEIERMPVRKRELLDSELRSGADVSPVRSAAPMKSIVTTPTLRRSKHA